MTTELTQALQWIRRETRLADKAAKAGDFDRAAHHTRGAAVALDKVSGLLEQVVDHQAAQAEREVA